MKPAFERFDAIKSRYWPLGILLGQIKRLARIECLWFFGHVRKKLWVSMWILGCFKVFIALLFIGQFSLTLMTLERTTFNETTTLFRYIQFFDRRLYSQF